LVVNLAAKEGQEPKKYEELRKAYLAVDGNSVLDIKSGDYITVKKSNRSTLMADLGLRSFFEIAFTKLT
jgi:NAD kinase